MADARGPVSRGRSAPELAWPSTAGPLGVRCRTWFDKAWRDVIIAIPSLWLMAFFLLPCCIIVAISLGRYAISRPPVTWDKTWPYLTWDNFTLIVTDTIYIRAYLNSLKFAAISTFCCLLIGYPMALGIARTRGVWRHVLLLLVILPFWTSSLLRLYAWIGLFNNHSWFNQELTWVVNHLFPFWGRLDAIPMMYTNFAVILGITYSYLPFMILPLYANLARLDLTLSEAAMDLGSRPWQVFRDITLPLSLPGIVAGSFLVFIPTTGELVIPTLMGRADSPMIGRVINDEFSLNKDWPVASAIAVALLLLLVVSIMLYNHMQAKATAPETQR